jgi:hypothetical protein
MNHGLINKVFYSGLVSNDQDLYEVYPDLNQLRKYFGAVNRRDRYYVAMKYHAVKVAKSIYPEIVLEQLADIINVTNHATVFYYINTYIPVEGHGEFISRYFNKFVQNQIYPLTAYGKDRKEHGLFKQVALEQCKKQREDSASEKKTERKRNNYVFAIKRNKAERY